MSLIPAWLRGGNDQQLAADLNAEASRQRRAGHRRRGAQRAADEGQAWEERDRARDRKGGWRHTDWTS